MTDLLRMKNLSVPQGMVDVVLDSDAYNEIDDQFAISYLLKSKEKLNTKAIYAAPFLNERSVSPADGMEKSYDEILHVLGLMGESKKVYKGSTEFLPDEHTPVTEAERAEERALVRRSIDQLGEPEREIFLRHYYYYQTVSEISQEMRLNESTIKTKLRRGRNRLRTILVRWGVV